MELESSSEDDVVEILLDRKKGSTRRAVRESSVESVEAVEAPITAKKNQRKQGGKKKAATARPAASANRRGGKSTNEGNDSSRKASATAPKKRGAAAGKSPAATGAKAGGKPKKKKRTNLPRAKESEAEKEARERATEKLEAKKARKWSTFYEARGVVEQDQAERADKRRQNDRSLQVIINIAARVRPKLENPGLGQRAGPRTAAPLSVRRITSGTVVVHRENMRVTTTPALSLRQSGTEVRQHTDRGLAAATRNFAGDEAQAEAITAAGRGTEAVVAGAVTCATYDRALDRTKGITPVVVTSTATGAVQGAANGLGTHRRVHERIPA
ncbi:unnamed protein product, partial [Ectocarpus sp. 12 AP-2014]